MNDPDCPNIGVCRLVTSGDIAGSPGKYLAEFCHAPGQRWTGCKRYQVNAMYHLCPDFVLPDTDLSPDEIIMKWDELLHSDHDMII